MHILKLIASQQVNFKTLHRYLHVYEQSMYALMLLFRCLVEYSVLEQRRLRFFSLDSTSLSKHLNYQNQHETNNDYIEEAHSQIAKDITT